jgi:phospholipase/lecithinase/hemolysin
VALTSKVLGAATVTALLSADPTNGAATVGVAYMTALATTTFNLVKSKVLDKGANKVVVANSPKLSVTPRLAIVLAGLQAPLGAPARAQLEGLFNTWVQSYNQQLAVKFSPEPRVAIFDLYALTDTFATTPATYSFTNSKDASCPPVGADASGPTYNLVKSKVLDKGASKVLLANTPKGSATPRLAIGLANVQAQLGAPARAQVEGLFNQWYQSYNQQLAVKFAPEPRVAIFDLYALQNTFATTPGTYGLTNSKDASCPPVGVDANGPTHSIATCTEAAANGYIASGQTGLISGTKLSGNITGFVYSDNFHPTPRGHAIAGEVAINLINAKGWGAR